MKEDKETAIFETNFAESEIAVWLDYAKERGRYSYQWQTIALFIKELQELRALKWAELYKKNPAVSIAEAYRHSFFFETKPPKTKETEE